MSEEVVIKVETEPQAVAVTEAEAVVETAVEGAVAIVEVAKDLAELMTDDDLAFEVLGRIDALFTRVDSLFQLVEVVVIKIDSLTALEVAEVVVENTPNEVEEIAAVVEVVEKTNAVPPEMPSEPELRKTSRRKWID